MAHVADAVAGIVGFDVAENLDRAVGWPQEGRRECAAGSICRRRFRRSARSICRAPDRRRPGAARQRNRRAWRRSSRAGAEGRARRPPGLALSCESVRRRFQPGRMPGCGAGCGTGVGWCSRLRGHAGWPGWAGAYLLAHLACSSVAWKTPSRPMVPSASAWESSLNVSGGGSDPL